MSTFHTVRKCIILVCFIGVIPCSYSSLHAQKLRLNDKEYFETTGLNIMVFSNEYNGMFFDEKTAGIEIIHHGVRTLTGGAVRLQNTPEQWDLIPKLVDRKIDKAKESITVELRYEAYDFNAIVQVKSREKGVGITVSLDKPLPEALRGRAGFNLEFLPSAYFEKSYLMDGSPGYFPLYPAGNTVMKPGSDKIPQFNGYNTFDDRGRDEYIEPQPITKGNNLILAPEDPERRIRISSPGTTLELYDGRNLAQNGWFIVRSLLPVEKTGEVLTWYVEPNTIPDWKREPMIGFSQVGYYPDQKKTAIIELDSSDTAIRTATLYQVTPEGESVKKASAKPTPWGPFLRYHYVTFDFSEVNEPGVYYLEYGNVRTNTFPIGETVYRDIGNPTLDVWFPVQMDHMMVNEGYRTWHGRPFADDALQAPLNLEHFDGYSMGDSTDTKYKPLEHIPGLAVGGWFDAGDFDIQTGSHCSTLLSFVSTWENFGLDRDETYIDQSTHYVDIHRPDGQPDLLQQIEHGTLNLVAQVKNIGHPVRGIVVPRLHQYHHLGDASTETDNLLYNKELAPYVSQGNTSGTPDDRWVFSTRMPWLDYFTVAAMAASSRALKEYNPALAKESLQLAIQLYEDTNALPAEEGRGAFWRANAVMGAALQLYISTTEKKYRDSFEKMIWPALEQNADFTISTAIQALPYMDQKFKDKLRPYVVSFKSGTETLQKENPYGVPMVARGWGANSTVINWALTNYFAHKAYPDLIGTENVFKGLQYIFGCHPYSNLSFVSAVGTRSKKVTYGNNRANFSFIAGGVVPGILVLTPDFPENKEDWPFLWGENECTIGIGASYILLSAAVNDLIRNEK